MQRLRIFISSVQKEFSKERKALVEYLLADPLLGRFFEPFFFEQLPAIDQRADQVYLNEVAHCDIYIGILGEEYGSVNAKGISPTEREFDCATKLHKTMLVFLSNHIDNDRHPSQSKFIGKVQNVLVRKSFRSFIELKSAVYASLIRVLFDREIIRSGPFDASLNEHATIDDIDVEKVKWFIRIARSKRGFPLPEESDPRDVLTHLNLLNDNRLSNAALLLFAKETQRFFINSEVRCAHFFGTEVAKPIPSYKVFKGNIFELVDLSVNFVLSKLDYSVGTREISVQIPGKYEIPKEIISEAIVNSIAHRDYTSNGSVQIMLFSDRLEIWNPGSLPIGWTTEKLKKIHTSIPANPLLAEPMYLAGYIERMGTGTSDMVRIAKETGLPEPEFIQEDSFIVKLFRPILENTTEQVREQVREQVGEQVGEQVKKLVLVINDGNSAAEIMMVLQLKGRRNFLMKYLKPAINLGFVEFSQPDSLNSPTQKYRLTPKGVALKTKLKKGK